MNEKSNESITTNPVWSRVVSMLVLVFAYSLAEIVLIALVIGQVLSGLIAHEQNHPMKKMGKQISDYIYEILMFLTFNTEQRPFPYRGWGEKQEVIVVIPGDAS